MNLSTWASGARRWLVVFNAIRKGEPLGRVVEKVSKRLYDGLRNALEQFAEHGVRLSDLLAARGSPQTLRQLVKQAEGHEYGVLLAQTAITENGTNCEGLLEAYLGNMWDKISDPVAHNVVGKGPWTNIVDVNIFLNKVRDEIEADVQRIAFKLGEDPTWQPRHVAKTDGDLDATTEALGMSLMGIPKE